MAAVDFTCLGTDYLEELEAGALGGERTPEPCTLVIFGASGDLTRRKLIPALYNLARERLLPDPFSVVGYARSRMTDEEFRESMREAVARFSRNGAPDPKAWEEFAQNLFYQSGPYDEAAAFHRLGERLDELDAERSTCNNRLFYLSTPPEVYTKVIHCLGESDLVHPACPGEGDPWSAIIVEKPFGHDLPTARKLNRQVLEVFREDQVYRIDHYLGKETVQNILFFRFANGIFEPIWNRRYVDHVQITVSETIGIEGRAGYYEQAGVMRDMIQNHLLQLFTLIAMEPPASFDADAVRDEKVKVLRATRPIEPNQVNEFTVRGQYGRGIVDGVEAPGYREEEGVDSHSHTETFVAMKFHIDNWRWAGVPFYLRSGKRLGSRVTEVAIQYRQAPHLLFRQATNDGLEPNVLALRIQPDEGIALSFGVKAPGPAGQIRPVTMDFRYSSAFGVDAPDAYERLLLDCMLGDSTLFTRNDEVERAWDLVTRIICGWEKQNDGELPSYEPGSWGPREAFEFIERDRRQWRSL